MAKKKRKTRDKGKGRDRHGPKGFDFGIDEKIALIGAIDFNASLRRAGIFGCAYGVTFDKSLGREMPIISLVGTDQTALEEAFREFRRWDDTTHGDALDLTFVFLKNGGYLIGISPTTEYLDKRFFSMDLIHGPIYSLLTWVKPIDTRSIGIEQIRDYKRKHFISPILFGGTTHKVLEPKAKVDHHDLSPIAVDPLLKFRATFIDEDDVKPHTVPGIVLDASQAISRKSWIPKDWPKPPVSGPSEFVERRSRFLTKRFPVTIERMRLFSAYQQLLRPLVEAGIRTWQCEQALCNLVLSHRLCAGKFHYTQISFSNLKDAIFSGLRNHVEMADGFEGIPPLLTADLIRRQVSLDSEFLLRHCGVNVTNLSAGELQTAMGVHRLLDGNDAGI